jgi:PKD repeat protein
MKFFYLLLIILIFVYNSQSQIKADFSVSKKVAFVGEQLYFENLSTGDSLNYRWDFGDFSSSYEKSPLHTYNVKGVFDVMLIAYNSTDSDTIIKNNLISVHILLKANFEYDVKGATGGYSVNCINMSEGDINSYKWNFYNGVISTEQNPTATYKDPGQYNIALKVSDGHFTDSLFVYDVVEIKHPQINIEKFNREHFYYDEGSNSVLGAKEITNGYLLASEGSRYFQILKFNHNRVLSWKKQYDNKYYSSIAFDVDGFDKIWVALNSDVYHTTIEVIDYSGETDFIISDPFNLMQNGEYEIIDLLKINAGIVSVANFGMQAVIKVFNSTGEEIYSESISDDDCLVDEYNIDFIKLTESFDGSLYAFMRKYNSENNDYKYYYTEFEYKDDTYICKNIVNGVCACKEIPKIDFEKNAEFIVYNQNDMLYIQDRKVFNVKDFKSEEPDFFNYTNLVHTDIFGIHILQEYNKFAVAGKFNGHMKLSIVDMDYDIVDDFLANRLGNYQSVYDDNNGNLILSGTIKKNYDEDAVYYLNIPFLQIISNVKENISDNISVYPNPANDYIFINSSKTDKLATIYNSLGIKIMEHNLLNNKINISELKPGLYLIEIDNEILKFIKL